MIVFVCGLPGSGKTYFAKSLATLLQAEYINSDSVRKRILAKPTYSEREKLSVYDQMMDEIKQAVAQHRKLVIDATFYKTSIRNKFREATRGEDTRYIEVVAEEAVIRDRLSRSRKDSDADFGVYQAISAQWEPLVDPHLVLHSTNDNLEEMIEKAKEYLHVSDDKTTD